jgi:hypothetical protein
MACRENAYGSVLDKASCPSLIQGDLEMILFVRNALLVRKEA